MDCLPRHQVQTGQRDRYLPYEDIFLSFNFVFFSFEGQNSEQQSVRVCKQKGQHFNFSFSVNVTLCFLSHHIIVNLLCSVWK